MENRFLGTRLKLSEAFNSPSQGRLSFSDVVVEVAAYIALEPKSNYRLIVGSDSQEEGEEVDYVAAVVVHRVGKGGIYFWQRVSGAKCFTLKERIYNEALISLELAYRLLNGFQAQGILGFDLEVHVDVGVNGETKNIINEITGLVRGSGFSVMTKPDSFGASKVADRHT